MKKVNLKDAKAFKKQVEEIKKKRVQSGEVKESKKATKSTEKSTKIKKNVQKKNKNAPKNKKTVQKVTKRPKEKKKKFRKFLFRLLAVEYITAGAILLWAFGTALVQTNEKLVAQIDEQQVIMKNLADQVTELRTKPATIKTIAEKQPAYNLTISERELLAQLLYHEARGESLECQKAVVSVVLNRLDSGIWGDTLKKVIYAKNQFEPVAKGLLPNTKPLQKQYEAIDYVLENGSTIPEDVLYFRADHYFEWGTAYMNIDNTYFSF